MGIRPISVLIFKLPGLLLPFIKQPAPLPSSLPNSLFPFFLFFKGGRWVVFTLLAAWWPLHPPGIFCKECYLCNIFRNNRKQPSSPSSSNSCRGPWSEMVAGIWDGALWAAGRGSSCWGGLVSTSLCREGSQNIQMDCQFIFFQGMSGASLWVWGRGACKMGFLTLCRSWTFQ